jgi:predicted O-methyltransferase YrrM
MDDTSYPKNKVHYIEGDVLETLSTTEVQDIALLRLDTDWYESTLAELNHLVPRLVKGGICIIDDYGHWEGSRKAVDEFFKNSDFRPLMIHVDYTCRAFIRN